MIESITTFNTSQVEVDVHRQWVQMDSEVPEGDLVAALGFQTHHLFRVVTDFCEKEHSSIGHRHLRDVCRIEEVVSSTDEFTWCDGFSQTSFAGFLLLVGSAEFGEKLASTLQQGLLGDPQIKRQRQESNNCCRVQRNFDFIKFNESKPII